MPETPGKPDDIAFTVSRRGLKRFALIGLAVLVAAGIGVGAFLAGRSASGNGHEAVGPGRRPRSTATSSPTITSAASTTTAVPTTSPPTTTTTAVDFSSLAGDYGAHDAQGLTITSSGVGSFGIADENECAGCALGVAPQNVVTFTLSSTSGPGEATGTVTSVTYPNDPPNAAPGDAIAISAVGPSPQDAVVTVTINGGTTTFCGPDARDTTAGEACGA